MSASWINQACLLLSLLLKREINVGREECNNLNKIVIENMPSVKSFFFKYSMLFWLIFISSINYWSKWSCYYLTLLCVGSHCSQINCCVFDKFEEFNYVRGIQWDYKISTDMRRCFSLEAWGSGSLMCWIHCLSPLGQHQLIMHWPVDMCTAIYIV